LVVGTSLPSEKAKTTLFAPSLNSLPTVARTSSASSRNGFVSGSAGKMMVTEVSFLNGTSNKWQGQEVTIRPLDVKALSQRIYSRQRTVLASIAIGGLIALTIATKGFSNLFSGDSGSDGKGGGPPPEQ